MKTFLSAGFGGLLLALGLIVWGLLSLASVSLPGIVIALWAIITGLLILVGR